MVVDSLITPLGSNENYSYLNSTVQMSPFAELNA
jgi:hypothetical protein